MTSRSVMQRSVILIVKFPKWLDFCLPHSAWQTLWCKVESEPVGAGIKKFKKQITVARVGCYDALEERLNLPNVHALLIVEFG